MHVEDSIRAVAANMSEPGTQVFFEQRPNSRFKTPLICDAERGFQLTYSADRKFVVSYFARPTDSLQVI